MNVMLNRWITIEVADQKKLIRTIFAMIIWDVLEGTDQQPCLLFKYEDTHWKKPKCTCTAYVYTQTPIHSVYEIYRYCMIYLVYYIIRM